MALIRCEISEGPRPGFKTLGVSSAEGHKEYLTIEERFLAKRGDELFLPVRMIGTDRRQDTVLIQFPSEADSGANRVWVRQADVVSKPDEVPA